MGAAYRKIDARQPNRPSDINRKNTNAKGGTMRMLSVKLRITLWLTLMMTFLSGLLLIFMLSMNSTVITQTSMTQLSQTLRNNLSLIDISQSRLQVDEEFKYYQNGVFTLIYSQNKTLMAGQLPVSFQTEEPFENGVTRIISSSGGERYFVLDFWIPVGWENGLWIRGLLEAPERLQAADNLLFIALISLPVFLILATLGGYRIIRRSFLPLDKITATADAINQAHDLSGRIGLPPGKDEFSRLAETFDQMFARLEHSFEVEKQFIADASHELRTPISIIQGACEYAEKFDETPEEYIETISMIRRQAGNMSDLITQLLNMARLDQGTQLACFESIDLTELTEAVCHNQSYDNERLKTKLQKNITVRADSVLLTRLLQNLLDNAFKYGKTNGQVQVTLHQSEDEILLSVQDNGIGIPEDQQEKIWQRFYQIDPSRSDGSGAGLGLSMVEQIALIHGGYMTLQSIPGEGSSFTLHLPFSEGDPDMISENPPKNC